MLILGMIFLYFFCFFLLLLPVKITGIYPGTKNKKEKYNLISNLYAYRRHEYFIDILMSFFCCWQMIYSRFEVGKKKELLTIAHI